jgi:hypothetical protein
LDADAPIPTQLSWLPLRYPAVARHGTADISPGLMAALGIQTDDEIEVIYPAPRA